MCFLHGLARRLRLCTDEPNSFTYLLQHLSVVIQVGNPTSVIGSLVNKFNDCNSEDFIFTCSVCVKCSFLFFLFLLYHTLLLLLSFYQLHPYDKIIIIMHVSFIFVVLCVIIVITMIIIIIIITMMIINMHE